MPLKSLESQNIEFKSICRDEAGEKLLSEEIMPNKYTMLIKRPFEQYFISPCPFTREGFLFFLIPDLQAILGYNRYILFSYLRVCYPKIWSIFFLIISF